MSKKLFAVSFSYKGPKANNPDCSEPACKALDEAINIVEDALNDSNLEHVYGYFWTDGSLYEYIRCSDENEIKNLQLSSGDVSINRIDQITGSTGNPGYHHEVLERFKRKYV